MTKLPTVRRLDDVRAILNDLPERDSEAARTAAAREAQLAKPAHALGRLEDLNKWMCAWQGRHPARLDRVRGLVFAGNHGVAERNLSPYPPEVTGQMVANSVAGGAAINQLAAVFDIDLRICEMALDDPTRDFLTGPAMADEECAEAIDFGMTAVHPKTDLLVLGSIGIGGSAAAAALCHALFGGAAATWIDEGAGAEGEILGRKTAVVADAVRLHATQMRDALVVLQTLGGREFAAIAGAVLAARLHGIPVILGGYPCTAAAATLQVFRPGALGHCQAGPAAPDQALGRLLSAIAIKGLLPLGIRLGEGASAALAVPIIRAALVCHRDMATSHEVGIDLPRWQ